MVLKISDRFKNRKIDFFTNFRITLKYDCIASHFSLDYFFDPDNVEHKEFSCVGHYHLCTLEDNGQLLLNGILVSIQFTDEPQKKLATVSGYSLPGVLEDCSIPKSAYPLQSDGLSLREIVQKFITPFGLKFVIDPSVAADMELPFDETVAGATQSVKSYLTELASQRNIIITNDLQGRVVFTRVSANKVPIFHFERGMPGVSMSLGFNGQGIHSDILAVMQADPNDDNAVEAEVTNPYVPIVFRPITSMATSGDGNTIQKVAENLRAAELRNIPLVISLDRWDINGKIVEPGEFITVINPQVYLYTKSKWFIESVEFRGDQKQKTAVLTCVRPEVYTGQNPEYLWKGINIHRIE